MGWGLSGQGREMPRRQRSCCPNGGHCWGWVEVREGGRGVRAGRRGPSGSREGGGGGEGQPAL